MVMRGFFGSSVIGFSAGIVYDEAHGCSGMRDLWVAASGIVAGIHGSGGSWCEIAVRCEIFCARSVTKNMCASRREILLKFSPKPQKRPAIAAGIIVVVLLCAGRISLQAQEKNPYAGDTKVAKLGEYQFRSNCAFCHGLGGRGGGRGPDLTRAQKHHGNTDGELFHNIHDGIAGTTMPAATNGGIGVGMSDEEIWQVITYIRSVEKKASAAETGDVAHGKELFYGAAGCGTCHMVNGKGGRLGPDLSSTGASRSVESLTESLRNQSKRLAQGISEPLKDFSQEYETVTVVTSDGTKLQGLVLNEDSFTVQMLDTREQLHAFEKIGR